MWRGEHDFHLFRSKGGVKRGDELAVMVVDQKAEWFCARSSGLQVPGKLSGLLGYPDRIGMLGDACQINPASAQFDEEQRVQRLQPDGFDGKEIAGQHLLFVMIQEGSP